MFRKFSEVIETTPSGLEKRALVVDISWESRVMDRVQHSEGCWFICIRYHDETIPGAICWTDPYALRLVEVVA